MSTIMNFNNVILVLLIVSSVYFDITKKKIPNFLTFPVILWGLLAYTVSGGLDGFRFSLYGFLAGLAVFLIPFALGGMGGGDVKLLAAVGALKGYVFVLHTALLAALCGGVMAVGYLLIKKRLWRTLRKAIGILAAPVFTFLSWRFRRPFIKDLAAYFSPAPVAGEEKLYLPYGVAIGLGALLVLFKVGELIFSI